MARSALYCERRSNAVGCEQEHLFTEKKVITNKRSNTAVVFTVCAYCGRKSR
jgi:hypothetical protein